MLERWRERDVFARSVEKHSRESLWSFYEGPPTTRRPSSLGPRPLARLQGHLPALPHDDRAPRAAARRAGTATGCRSSSRSRRSWGSPRRPRSRSTGSRSSTRALPRVGLPLRGGVEPADRADRVLDRPRRPLRDDGGRLHRVWLVGPAADVGRRAAVRGHKVVPTARAAAATRSHEVALGYHDVEDLSVYVKLPIRKSAVRPDPRVAAGARRSARSGRPRPGP